MSLRAIALILLLLFFIGCQTAWVKPHNYEAKGLLFCKKPPEFEKLKEIYKKKYVEHVYDCSNKSAEYASHLKEKGIFSQILSIDYDGPRVMKLIYSERIGGYAIERHAIVRIYKDKKFIYVDPTNFKWSEDIRDFAPAGHSGITGVINIEEASGSEFDF